MGNLGRRSAVALTAVGLMAGATAASAGGLAFVEAVSSMTARGAIAVAVSPDGAHVYVTNDVEDSVDAYARETNPLSVSYGKLTLIDTEVDDAGGVDGLRGARGVAVSPDGECVYVSGEQDDAIAVFERDTGTGALTFLEVHVNTVGGIVNMRSPFGIAVSGDDEHVYVLGEQDNAILAFDRTPPACDLTLLEVEQNAINGVLGMRRPRGIAISHDGSNVYVAGGGSEIDDDAVAVFSRNAGTGDLTFLEFHQKGLNGVDGIANGHAIAVSPDDASVYSVGRLDHAIAVFARATSGVDLGKLTWIERHKDGGIVDGLKEAHAVAVSPDGAYVYVAGRGEAALAVFRRDASTSRLAFLEVHRDSVLGVEGLLQVAGVAASPDGAHLYAAARNGLKSTPQDGTVVTFAVDACGNGARGTDEQCDDGNVTPGDGCSPTCTLERCPPVPMTGCREPIVERKSAVRIKEYAGENNKDSFFWKWTKGAATAIGEFDDPVNGDSYVICVYDGSGAAQPVLSVSVPAGGTCAGNDCWEARTTAFKYKDKSGSPDGIQNAQLKAGVTGKAKFQFKGKNANLYFRTGGNLLSPTGLTLPVTVQLTNTDTVTPICWEGVYSTALHNDGEQFKAKGQSPIP